MEGLRSAVPISSRAVQQCSRRRRGPGRLVYKSTRLLQQSLQFSTSLVYKSRQSLPFVCRSTLLRPTTAQEGLKKSPRHWRAPTTSTTSDPKTIQCVAQHAIQRLMIRGLGKPSHWSRQQRTPHPNVISQLCLKWENPTFLWINCRTLQREGKEIWRLLCVNHHGV